MKSCVVLLFLLLFQNAFTFENYSGARHFALCGAYSALAQGSEAAFVSPANLAMSPDSALSFSFLGGAANISNNAFQKNHYDKYNGQYLDDYDIASILKAIPDDGVTAAVQGGALPFSVAYGPYAFFVAGKHGTVGSFADDLFDVAFNGNEVDKVYDFQPFNLNSASYVFYGASYGRRFELPFDFLPSLDLGVTFALYRGYAYYKMQQSTIHTLTSFDNIYAEGSASVIHADRGKGMGMNIAAATSVDDWRIDVLIENVFSKMRWHKNVIRYSYEFVMNETNVEEILEKEDVIDELFETVSDTSSLEAIETHLPRVLRLGLAKPVSDVVLLTMDLTAGFSQTALSTPKLISHFGAEWNANDWLDVRAGFYVGGMLSSAFSAGVGLHSEKLWFDVGMRSYGGVVPATSKGVGAAFGITYRL